MESVSWGGEVGGGGGAGFQYTHLHIKTTLAQDSAEREGGGGAEGGGKGNEGGFISSLPLRPGQGWKSMRKAH